MTPKPFSEACERNKGPILAVIRPLLAKAERVLEIGSGTGQHAVYFAGELPHIEWQTSDVTANLPGIRAWLTSAGRTNLPPPLELDVLGPWPPLQVDAVFSANTAHIMPWNAVEAMFRGVRKVLRPGGYFCLYGPFNYGGRYTSASNRAFDHSLRTRDPAMGIRDIEAVQQLAAPMMAIADHAMPANNRLLVWQLRADDGG